MALMFPAPENTKRVVVRCMGCRENIPAPVRVCALPTDHRHCGEHRRWSEVFLGRLSHSFVRKPVVTADRWDNGAI
jgi:hypothetical protein